MNILVTVNKLRQKKVEHLYFPRPEWFLEALLDEDLKDSCRIIELKLLFIEWVGPISQDCHAQRYDLKYLLLLKIV